MDNIEKIQEYVPIVYVNDSSPDLDEVNLNKAEQAIKRVTDAANKAIQALNQLEEEKLSLSAISNVLSDAVDKVPSLALVNTMQHAINEINSNLNQKANSSELTRVSNVATAANGKVELSGGPTKIIAYAGDGNWSFQQQYGDGVILSLGMNDTQIFYDYYDGKTWTRKWTK